MTRPFCAIPARLDPLRYGEPPFGDAPAQAVVKDLGTGAWEAADASVFPEAGTMQVWDRCRVGSESVQGRFGVNQYEAGSKRLCDSVT